MGEFLRQNQGRSDQEEMQRGRSAAAQERAGLRCCGSDDEATDPSCGASSRWSRSGEGDGMIRPPSRKVDTAAKHYRPYHRGGTILQTTRAHCDVKGLIYLSTVIFNKRGFQADRSSLMPLARFWQNGNPASGAAETSYRWWKICGNHKMELIDPSNIVAGLVVTLAAVTLTNWTGGSTSRS